MNAKGPVSEEARQKFGRALRRARLKAGLTQAQVSQMTGVPEADISRIENGKMVPSIERFELLANAVGMELDLIPRPPSRNRKAP